MPRVICYYHIVWATKHRQSLITPQIETVILDVIRRKSHALKSRVHAINTMPDHLHVAVSIRVSLSVAEWVRQVKALSSKVVRESFDMDESFSWQSSYSVQTFGEKALPMVVAYINNQKHRHAHDDVLRYLEIVPDE